MYDLARMKDVWWISSELDITDEAYGDRLNSAFDSDEVVSLDNTTFHCLLEQLIADHLNLA